MEASKVILTDTTKAQIHNPLLDKVRRSELRRQLIVDYIRSKPAGTTFRFRDLAVVAKMAPNVVSSFLQRMERDGMITIKKDHGWRYNVWVNGDAKTVKQATAPSLLPTPAPTLDTPPKPVETRFESKHNLIEYAKEFTWEKGSDSLREFVAWMDGKELELRRLADASH